MASNLKAQAQYEVEAYIARKWSVLAPKWIVKPLTHAALFLIWLGLMKDPRYTTYTAEEDFRRYAPYGKLILDEIRKISKRTDAMIKGSKYDTTE